MVVLIFGAYMLKGKRLHYFSRCFSLEKAKWEKLVDGLVKQGVLRSPNVIKAMRNVPRGRFLARDEQAYSASDTPLPIGFGQTISAPHSFSCVLG